MSVVPLSELGLCTTDAVVVQAACEAAIDARQASFTTWAQTGATAAIVAANLPDSADVQIACDAAILARQASFTTWAQTGAAAAILAANIPDSTDIQAACDAAILARQASFTTWSQTGAAAAITAATLATAANVAAVPAATKALAVGATPLHTTVNISGAGVSGTVVAAPAAGSRIHVTAVLVSCTFTTTTSSSFSFASAGGDTMGNHPMLVNTSIPFSLPNQSIFVGGDGTSLTANKDANATLVIDVYYWIGP